MRDDAESLLPQALVVDHQAGTVTVDPDRARRVFYADCEPEVAAWATRQLVPEPRIAPGAVPGPAAASPQAGEPGRLPRVYIETLHDRALGPATQRRMYEALPCDRVFTLPTDHSPFLSAPDQLATCLLDAARLL